MAYFPSYLPLFVIILIVVTRRPAHLLRRRGAITAETAQPVDDFTPRDRQRLDRLVAQGMIRESSPGRYYSDVESERARMRKKMPWLLGLAVVLILVAIALAWYNSHHVEALP
jgi:hypothetical protein